MNQSICVKCCYCSILLCFVSLLDCYPLHVYAYELHHNLNLLIFLKEDSHCRNFYINLASSLLNYFAIFYSENNVTVMETLPLPSQ